MTCWWHGTGWPRRWVRSEKRGAGCAPRSSPPVRRDRHLQQAKTRPLSLAAPVSTSLTQLYYFTHLQTEKIHQINFVSPTLFSARFSYRSAGAFSMDTTSDPKGHGCAVVLRNSDLFSCSPMHVFLKLAHLSREGGPSNTMHACNFPLLFFKARYIFLLL